MSDLVKALRSRANALMVANDAADEIERLQAQIAAMTKDMESIKPWRELQEENRRLKEDRDLAYEAATTLKRENEELRVAEQRRIEAQVCCTDWEHCIRGCVPRLERENEELHAALNADWGDGVMQENLKAKKELAAARRENEELRKAFEAEQVDCTRECDVYLETKREMDYEKELTALKRENEELRKRLPVHDEYCLREELAALKAKLDAVMLEHCPDEITAEQLEEWSKHQKPAKQESAEQPVAIVKVWTHPIDGNHIDVSTYKAILDLPEGEYDLYLEPQTTPTAAIEDFKRRAVEACIALIHEGNSEQYCMGAMWASERIRAMPLIEEKAE